MYIGTFWDHQLHNDINRRLFQDEQHDLFADLQSLPRNAALRKLNDLIKRARLAKVHAYIIAELRKQMPSMIGKEKKKKELIQNLDKIFEQLQVSHTTFRLNFGYLEGAWHQSWRLSGRRENAREFEERRLHTFQCNQATSARSC